MKQLFTVLLILACMIMQAQKPKAGVTTIKLPKSKLIEAKSIRGLIILPKGCKVGSYMLTIRMGSNIKEIKGKGEALSKEAMAALKHLNPNQVFVIDNIKASCKGVKKSYEVTVK